MRRPPTGRPPCTLPTPQNKLFGALGGTAPCTVQLELRPAGGGGGGGQPQPTVTVKNRREEVETMPLFGSKDTIAGEVRWAGAYS